MRKNQKYTKEEIYMAIELWQESGLSQYKYCKQEGISRNTFKYWLNKYRKETDRTISQPFIPVKVSSSNNIGLSRVEPENITITYPNGIEVSCPAQISPQQLRALINQ